MSRGRRLWEVTQAIQLQPPGTLFPPAVAVAMFVASMLDTLEDIAEGIEDGSVDATDPFARKFHAYQFRACIHPTECPACGFKVPFIGGGTVPDRVEADTIERVALAPGHRCEVCGMKTEAASEEKNDE